MPIRRFQSTCPACPGIHKFHITLDENGCYVRQVWNDENDNTEPPKPVDVPAIRLTWGCSTRYLRDNVGYRTNRMLMSG
jgi:hypothetical protein